MHTLEKCSCSLFSPHKTQGILLLKMSRLGVSDISSIDMIPSINFPEIMFIKMEVNDLMVSCYARQR